MKALTRAHDARLRGTHVSPETISGTGSQQPWVTSSRSLLAAVRGDTAGAVERVGVRAAATERMLDTLLERLARRLAHRSKPGLDSIGFDTRLTQNLE